MQRSRLAYSPLHNLNRHYKKYLPMYILIKIIILNITELNIYVTAIFINMAGNYSLSLDFPGKSVVRGSSLRLLIILLP